MNIIYLTTKELLYQAKERGRLRLKGKIETGPLTQFSQFLPVLWFRGKYLKLERC